MLLLVNRTLLHCNKTAKNKRARRLVVQKQFSQQIFIFETVFCTCLLVYTHVMNSLIFHKRSNIYTTKGRDRFH